MENTIVKGYNLNDFIEIIGTLNVFVLLLDNQISHYNNVGNVGNDEIGTKLFHINVNLKHLKSLYEQEFLKHINDKIIGVGGMGLQKSSNDLVNDLAMFLEMFKPLSDNLNYTYNNDMIMNLIKEYQSCNI